MPAKESLFRNNSLGFDDVVTIRALSPHTCLALGVLVLDEHPSPCYFPRAVRTPTQNVIVRCHAKGVDGACDMFRPYDAVGPDIVRLVRECVTCTFG